MRIVQVSPRYPPATGGIERHVRAVSERLAARGHDVAVVTMGDGWRTRREVIDGVTVVRVPGLAPGNAYHFAPTVATALRGRDPDVVHAHGYHSLPLLFAGLGTPRNAPLVATPHYLGHATGVRGVLHSAYRPFGRFSLRRARTVVAVSDWERTRLREELGIDAIVVPNGVDVDSFAGATPHRSASPYLLSAGRLVESKGVQHAIAALDRLPEYELTITGTGPYEPELRRTAREAGVDDRVEFLGYVSEERLRRLYAGAEVHVTLSEFECYGLTVGESLAAGTPAVVYDRTALSDWTRFRGCLGVDDRAPDSVADAIRAVRGREPDPTALVDWDRVVDRLVDEAYPSVA